MENLDKLVNELRKLPTETQWLEFKHNNYTPDMIGKDISALANSASLYEKSCAYMLWGIDDETHEIVGTDYDLQTLKKGNQELENWLRSLLSKNADFEFHTVQMAEEKRVGVLIIYKATNQTVMFDKVDYIRVGSYTKRLSEYPAMQAQLWDKIRNSRFEERYNLAKSTRYSYWSGINIHLIPMLGEVSLNKLTPQMIDDMIAQLREKGLAENSVRYCHRILSSALSSAVKYGYIPNNPAKNIMTRFSKNAGRKYDKYTVEQVQQLLAFVHGNALETVVLLAVLFGLRLSEALGLRWRDVDLTHRQITLRGQIPCDLPKDAKIVPHLEPLKDRDEGETRSFPITEEALPIFLRLRQEQADQRRLCKLGGVKYYDNDLVVCKPDGSPYLQKRISVKFNGFMRSTGMPKIRFHDLRGTAGTNMYNLTGDFYAVSQILGHSVDDFSQQMGVNLKINTVTIRYVQVQEQRKLSVLTAYHQAVFATPKNAAVGDNSL